jgi:PAS domain-containing protein
MKAPRIYVVVGVNWRTGDLLGWSFDEDEARARRDELNRENCDDFACKVEECEAMP